MALRSTAGEIQQALTDRIELSQLCLQDLLQLTQVLFEQQIFEFCASLDPLHCLFVVVVQLVSLQLQLLESSAQLLLFHTHDFHLHDNKANKS